MTAESLARQAHLLAHRSRAAMCLALIDGQAWTAGELARHAGISAPTASEHLTVLADGGILAELRQGRHRYLRLAGPAVAQLIEHLGGPLEKPIGLRSVRVAERLAAGRTCYNHLAGDLGVSIHDALADQALLTESGLTDAGRDWFSMLLGPECLQRRATGPLVRSCLDWTRRTYYLGGALGAGLCAHLFEQQWVLRSNADRAVTTTSLGRRELRELLSI
ncbi:MAG: helix-turn-helix domain-containing protein [Salinibacterium sp.]|nr:helix-turn-helix domain-containing protein [Salinibacterium sp.]